MVTLLKDIDVGVTKVTPLKAFFIVLSDSSQGSKSLPSALGTANDLSF